jgi:hypothetical protein
MWAALAVLAALLPALDAAPGRDWASTWQGKGGSASSDCPATSYHTWGANDWPEDPPEERQSWSGTSWWWGRALSDYCNAHRERIDLPS